MFRDRQMGRLALARLLSSAGAEGTFFVGIWGRAAFEMDATPAQLALVMAAMGVAGLVASLVSGTLVDRYGVRRVVIAGELLVVPSTVALILPRTLGELTIVVAFVGFASMVVFNAIASFPPTITDDPDRLSRGNALLDVAFTAAFAIGPATAAALSSLIGLEAVFLADAATSLLAVALCTALPRHAPGPAEARSPLRWRDVTAGLRFAYRQPRIRHVLALGALTWLSIGFFGALEPLYFRDTLQVDASTLGWVNSVFGLGMAAGAVLLDRAPRVFASLPRITGLAGGAGVGAVIYAGTDNLAVVVAGAVVWGVLLGVLSPMVRTVVQLETPDALTGRAMGAVQLHERAGDLSPLAVAPLLASTFGAQTVLIASGLLVLTVCGVMVPAASRLERAPRRRSGDRPTPAIA